MCSIQMIAIPRLRSSLMVPTSSIASAVREAAADLVEEQHLRVGRKRACELEPFAIEQARDRPPGGWRRRRDRTSRSTSTTRAYAAERRWSRPACAPTSTFSNTVMPVERARNLVRPSDAEPAAPIRAHAGDVISLVANASRRWDGSSPRECSAASSCPAPLGPTTPTDSPGRELKVNAVQDHERAEALGDAGGLEQRGSTSARRYAPRR